MLKRILTTASAGLLAAVALASSAQAASYAPCQTRVVGKHFAKWADQADYFLLTNGGFESGSTGWTLAGGAVVGSGQEPFGAFSGGTHSLLLPSSSASATTGAFCVQTGEDAGRAFVLSPGVVGALLHVTFTISMPNGQLVGQFGADLPGSFAGWMPTPVASMPNLHQYGPQMVVQVSFQPAGVSAPWQLDDVAIDPFKGG